MTTTLIISRFLTSNSRSFFNILSTNRSWYQGTRNSFGMYSKTKYTTSRITLQLYSSGQEVNSIRTHMTAWTTSTWMRIGPWWQHKALSSYLSIWYLQTQTSWQSRAKLSLKRITLIAYCSYATSFRTATLSSQKSLTMSLNSREKRAKRGSKTKRIGLLRLNPYNKGSLWPCLTTLTSRLMLRRLTPRKRLCSSSRSTKIKTMTFSWLRLKRSSWNKRNS